MPFWWRTSPHIIADMLFHMLFLKGAENIRFKLILVKPTFQYHIPNITHKGQGFSYFKPLNSDGGLLIQNEQQCDQNSSCRDQTSCLKTVEKMATILTITEGAAQTVIFGSERGSKIKTLL